MTDARSGGSGTEVLGLASSVSARAGGVGTEVLGDLTVRAFAGGIGTEVLADGYLPPGPPTNVVATPGGTTILLEWDPPVTGGPVTGYDVRIDAGGEINVYLDEFYTFTGLSPGTTHTVAVRAHGVGYGPWVLLVGITTLGAPGPPVGLVATPQVSSIGFAWNPPVTGGPVTSYEVRIDTGPGEAATSPHTFLGLAPGSGHLLEVRALGPGGTSPWALISTTTLETAGYRVKITAGAHTWEATSDDDPVLGVALPVTFGWQVRESVEFFPAQPDPISGSFRVVVDSVSEVADLAILDPVLIDMWVPIAPDGTPPWQHVPGVVSQVDATIDPDGRGRVTVFFTDPLLILAHKVVGGVEEWPQESVYDRVERIAAEAGILTDWFRNNSSEGILPHRDPSPTDALSALSDAMRDNADLNTSEGEFVDIYGRPVYSYVPADNTLYLRVWDQRTWYWPAHVVSVDSADTLVRWPGTDGALDGCAVETGGDWSRLPIDRPTYVIVDDTTYGDPDAVGAVPYLRSTRYVYTDPLDPDDPSVIARDILGNSLLAAPAAPTYPDPTNPAWRSDTIRHHAHLDPLPVTQWFGARDDDQFFLAIAYESMPWLQPVGAPPGGVRPVVVEPVDEALTLTGDTWISGLLSGARFTLPPGGRFVVDVTIRPDPWPDIWVPPP